MPVTYNLIASNTLSSSAASVTFSAIPNTYTDLVLRVSGRTDFSGDLLITFNADTATNYSRTEIYGDGSTSGSFRASNASSARFVYSLNPDGSTSNTFSNSEIYIPNYLASANKPFSGNGRAEGNASSPIYLSGSAMLWRNTAAITSIKLETQFNFVSGSSFFLYGIKNS